MDIVVKVIIDEKEYDRLLEIERRYNELSRVTSKSQAGAGKVCQCINKDMPLNEIVTRNEEQNAVSTPIPGVLPSITVPLDTNLHTTVNKLEKTPDTADTGGEGAGESHTTEDLGIVKFVHPWYFIGPPHKE